MVRKPPRSLLNIQVQPCSTAELECAGNNLPKEKLLFDPLLTPAVLSQRGWNRDKFTLGISMGIATRPAPQSLKSSRGRGIKWAGQQSTLLIWADAGEMLCDLGP